MVEIIETIAPRRWPAILSEGPFKFLRTQGGAVKSGGNDDQRKGFVVRKPAIILEMPDYDV